MFVNDTSHLPESGRVCVMGFQPRPSADRRYYSVLVNAARAEVEPMNEPRNPAHVLGVGGEVQSTKGSVFAAYFAATRERFDTHPDYKAGLFVLVDGAVYSVQGEKVRTTLRRGLLTREFTLLRDGRPQRSVEYRWPFYREPFDSGLGSSDLFRELSAMVREFGPREQ
jgi:hypothetical protein